jgi:putative hydrolase of the HAD superfamily
MFDADGVVIQSQMFSEKYAQESNTEISELDDFFQTDFQECLVGRSDLKIAVAPWLEKWSWPGSVDDFLAYWFKSEHNLNLELIESIRELRQNNIRCVLATNQEKYRVEYMKKEMGFDTIFDKVYSSDRIGFKKPDVRFYSYILDNLNIDPTDIIFYDDSLGNIESARSLGIDSHLYHPGLKLV